MQGHMGGKRGGVAGREHEAAKGGYGLTGNDILKTTSESTLSVR